MPVHVQITRLPNAADLELPKYATEGSVGLDLRAAIESDQALPPNQRALVDTGIAIGLPIGYEAQIRPRSGLAFEYGLTVLNSPGTIDADYRGEIKVLLLNCGYHDFKLTRGLKIAQMVVAPATQIVWDEVDHLIPTARGAGGFGSTGE